MNELRVAGVTTVPGANAYLRETFLPHYHATFGCAPRDPAPAWVPLGDVDVTQILCVQETRVVARDNTVTLDGQVFQIAAQPGRRTCAGLEVVVRRHLTGQVSIWRGAQRLGGYDARGRPVDAPRPRGGHRADRTGGARDPAGRRPPPTGYHRPGLAGVKARPRGAGDGGGALTPAPRGPRRGGYRRRAAHRAPWS